MMRTAENAVSRQALVRRFHGKTVLLVTSGSAAVIPLPAFSGIRFTSRSAAFPSAFTAAL